jgi:membrane protease YdiL (CAAX protease family)
MAIMALVGVGWLARRPFGSALERLGVVVPTWRQAAAGMGTGLLLVPAIILLEHLFSRVGMGPNPDVERLTEQMIGPLVASVPGILTLGLAAALGEETIFRGAMQPRFGLFLTAAIFALLHSNYGITLSTLLVFLVGLVLGVLRLRWNTTTSMIAHAIYNMTLGVIAYLGVMQNF